MSKDDFASLMEGGPSAATGRASTKLRAGQLVEGTVVQISKDSVFVDVGATSEGRIDRGEFEDRAGELKIKVGDKVRASVVSVSDVTGPVLAVSLGKNQKGGIDVGALESAKESGVPVTGTVQKAIKGGVEVLVGSVRAFCPASQVDAAYVADLSTFEGQTLSFRVMEVKDNGRSVVLSRKALLEEERAREAERLLAELTVGSDFQGTVTSVQKYGAFIDLGAGIEGLVHVSELSHTRVDRVEDMLGVGEQVTVRLLALEPSDKGPFPKLRLSLKAREQAPESPSPEPGEVLEGTVSKVTSFGIFVDTKKGTGLVPARELGIPRGADHRKQFPPGKEVKVVLVNRDDSGKTTFSIARVAGVEERRNYREFTAQGKSSATEAKAVGSFGELLQKKLGIQPTAPKAPQARPVAAAAPAPAAGSEAAARAATAAEPSSDAPSHAPAGSPAEPSEPRFYQHEVADTQAQPKTAQRTPPPGVFRRKS